MTSLLGHALAVIYTSATFSSRHHKIVYNSPSFPHAWKTGIATNKSVNIELGKIVVGRL